MTTTTTTTTTPATTAPPVAVAPPRPPGRSVTIRGREYPVVLPKLSDVRLRLTATILAIQLLGQTVLRFKISIAQILITMLVCGVIEFVLTLRREHMIVWPASAFQTGASVAFILRASGTRHGDLWSLRGIHFFVFAGVVSMAAKYLIRPNGKRHIFNPSNVGMVAVLLVIGPAYVFSEHLWWAPGGWRAALAWAVILFAGWWILRPVKMVPMGAAFLASFGVLIGIWALLGRSFYATWSPDAISGRGYFVNIALSPEVWAYVYFMMSDPQTAPKSRRGRVVYGILTAVVTAALVYPQHTEFAIKVAILASLSVACAMVPAIEYWVNRSERRLLERAVDANDASLPRRLLVAAARPAVLAAAIFAVAAGIDTARLANDRSIVLIERDLPGPGTAPGSLMHNPHRQ
ncbi:MAG TPA: hypothetical protein VFJ85_13255 [Acidimicrobiales bacterium]|nr:hypothetical protein [Acidimicrobiales bacterium]